MSALSDIQVRETRKLAFVTLSLVSGASALVTFICVLCRVPFEAVRVLL
jgi:hypothetical protein